MMRNVWGRRGFLAVVALLFLLSFGLPALGERGRSHERMSGAEALFGAALALTHPSSEDGPSLILLGLSAQSNLFFVWGWVVAAFPAWRSRRRDRLAMMAWGLLSVVLAVLPLFFVGLRMLLVGYYVWVAAIGSLALWLWCAGRDEQLAEGAKGDAEHFLDNG
jgi:hypothetical protein